MSGTEEVEDIAGETRYVYTHVGVKMVQATSLIAPTLGLGRQLYRKNFSVNRWLRNSAAWTFIFGSTSGLAMAYLRLRNEEPIAIYDRAFRLRANETQVRVDDYTKVGALLGALITTTVFYKRARLINNLAGGAALGIAGGVLTHVAQLAQSGGSQAVAEEVQALPDPVELGKGVKEGK